ncbi:MAG: tRNA pseudouridine(55) synthase TruB [Flavobacteriales bacterium]|nr:MAG: tRNA pseudouridine(55) synthase TruB [Flavobacteriales bacterium]
MEQEQSKFQTGQIILIDKPLTWTSFDVVNKVRWLIKQEIKVKKIKVGHAGTLDPLATGLLILCTGKFTKQINDIQTQEKEYTGIITLGATTASYDLEKPIDIEYPTDHITEELIKETAQNFIGEQEQVAPIHSAKKIDGKRAYEYAREGETVVIKSNTINIAAFDVELCDAPVIECSEDSKINQEASYQTGINVKFRIVCSKGTYIRAIARDFGEKLNSGGHLSQLRRTKIGDYKIEDAIKMDSIGELFIFPHSEIF